MMKCTCSDDAFAYNHGLKGENADQTKILFVLHRSDSRALPENWESATKAELTESYFEALKLSQTGRLLGWLFEHCDIGYEDIYLTNMYKCLLPEDRNPRKAEYLEDLCHLEHQVDEEFKPEKLVVFGSKPFEIMFPEESKNKQCGEAVGSVFEYHGVPALLCYHPRWIWSMSKDNRKAHFQLVKDFLES